MADQTRTPPARPDHPTLYGAVLVGERGQIVIPAAARRDYDIDAGDRLLVFGHPGGLGLLVVKIDAFAELIDRQMLILETARTWAADDDESRGTAESSGPHERGEE